MRRGAMAWNRGARWVASHLALVGGLAASQARISDSCLQTPHVWEAK